MEIPKNCKYTKEHEWARPDGTQVLIGITDYAQSELGDLVYVDLPSLGTVLEKGKPLGTVESVKAVSDVYSPLSGVVKKINTTLETSPQLLNEAPYTDGWLVALEPKDKHELNELMDAKSYQDYIAAVTK